MRHLAFLRAINVGGRVVTMDRLRALCEAAGLRGVETFIASGNVLFDAPARGAGTLESRLERALADGLGYEVATFVRSPAEVAAAAAHAPFGAGAPAAGHTMHVGFLKAEPGAEARRRVEALATDYDALCVHGRELYWLCRGRSSDSTITNARLERALGAPATFRSVTTVRKLAAMVTL
jgi:uncharacterized protein (DUF1697 family)